MSDKPDPILQQKEQQQLKKQLLWRLGIAGTLIAGVLGAITWLDREEKNPPPEVQTPQIAPTTISVTAIPSPTPAAVEPTAEIASAPAATEIPTPVPTATTQARNQTAPNQTPIEAISNVPKRPTESEPAKKPSTTPISSTESSAEPKFKLNTTELGLSSTPKTQFPKASNTQLGYSVQAGVFLHSNNAEKLLAQIQAAGIPAYLETRVQIGPFKTRAEAETAVNKLRKLGIEPIVKSE